MTIIRTPAPSVFRPKRRIDQGILGEDKALIEKINRRNVLRGALSLGALSLLTGCDVTETDQVQSVLRAVSAWNDRVQEFVFRPIIWRRPFRRPTSSSPRVSTPITTSKT